MKKRTRNCDFSLPSTVSTELSFYAEDTEKKFRRSCKTEEDTWPWRTAHLTYRLNSQGYRAEDFDRITWSNCLIITGCESVFGVGVDTKDTLPSVLSRILDLPVINLGVNLGSMLIAQIDLTAVLNRSRPLGVITCWPDYRRFPSWKETEIQNCSEKTLSAKPHNHSAASFYRSWNLIDHHAEFYAKLVQNSVNMLCSSAAIPQYECSFSRDTADLLSVDCYSTVKDHSRDGEHRGVKTYQHCAELIAEKWHKLTETKQQ